MSQLLILYYGLYYGNHAYVMITHIYQDMQILCTYCRFTLLHKSLCN